MTSAFSIQLRSEMFRNASFQRKEQTGVRQCSVKSAWPAMLARRSAPARVWPERGAGVVWDAQGLVQVRLIEDSPKPTDDLAIVCAWFATTSSTARSTNVRNVLLLRSNAAYMAGE
jgi:hypothetical protein